jgi:UDP-N-acetylglucosamine acyltransferase
MLHQSTVIHPTAIVDPSATVGEGTSVGAYSIIGAGVVVGRNNRIGPHVVIEGNTRIGDENEFFQFCSVGARPQDLKYRGEPSELHIGNRNIIREYVTLQPGTSGGGMVTRIGDSNLFMANTHVGHDSVVGNRCIMANSAALAGHVTLGDGVVIGGLVGIHQFVKIGDLVMIGGGAMVTRDIPPFCIAVGDRATLQGLNHIGLERGGVSREEISLLRKIYRDILIGDSSETKGMRFKERVDVTRARAQGNAKCEAFIEFIDRSERGIASHAADSLGE